MKKVLGSMSKFIFGGFAIAVLILLASLTYGALGKLFPGSFMNQMWGLVLFDIGALCWALAFVFHSKSTGQYAVSGLGFVVGFLGTILMVAYEVVSSGQNVANIDKQALGDWVVYGFIGATALHAALIYAHHGLAPEVSEQINVGIARGEVVTQAISDATHIIESEKYELSRAIRNDIVSQVKRDLGMHSAAGTIFEPKQLDIPVTWAEQEPAQVPLRREPEPISKRLQSLLASLRKQEPPHPTDPKPSDEPK